MDAAVEHCIANGILEKLLMEHRAEVYEMVLFEYDEEAHIASEKEISREEGLAQGGFLAMISLTKKKLQRGKSLSEIAQDLEEDESALEPIFLAVQKEPQKSPEEILELLSENR